VRGVHERAQLVRRPVRAVHRQQLRARGLGYNLGSGSCSSRRARQSAVLDAALLEALCRCRRVRRGGWGNLDRIAGHRHGMARERASAEGRGGAALRSPLRTACVLRRRRGVCCLGRSGRAPDRHAQSLGSPSGFRADQAHGAHRARAAPGGAVMGLGLGSEPILAEGRARLAWVVPPGIAVLGDGHELHGGEARAGHVRQPARCRLKRALRREAAHVHLPPVARAASGGPPPSRTVGP